MTTEGLVVAGFDISGICTGYGVARAVEDQAQLELLDCGRLRPKNCKNSIQTAMWLTAGIEAMIDEHKVAAVVIEVPSTREHGTAARGLASLGFVVGFVFSNIVRLKNCHVRPFYTDQWGGISKSKRKRVAMAHFLQYTGKGDGGYDTSDALAMLVMLWQTRTIDVTPTRV